MMHPDRPMIIINTSDLGYGIRFSFIQEYFDLLCSELNDYPVADAVAASSAVPVLFNPIVIQNIDGCQGESLGGIRALHDAQEYYAGENLPVLIRQLSTYENKDRRRYIHFVDGGITDNLGLRAVSDMLAAGGGPAAALERDIARGKVPRRFVVIMVNAAVASNADMDLSNKDPSVTHVVGAVTNLQLQRYDEDSIYLVKQNLEKIAEVYSTAEQPATSHFIGVSIEDTDNPDLLEYLNGIPTSFKLSDAQVDSLIESGRTILRNNPEFIALMKELSGR